MSRDDDSRQGENEAPAGTDAARREALVKIGKYAAYTAPAMLVTVRSAGATVPVPTSTPPVHFL